MPTEREHKQAAERNLEVALKVVDEYPEWGAITAFYSALHRVCEACATHSVCHNEHFDRNGWLNQNWREVWKPYKFLYDESMKARYLTHGIYSLDGKQVRKRIIEGACKQVESLAAARHKSPLIPPTSGPKV